jgi:hypothetical protein
LRPVLCRESHCLPGRCSCVCSDEGRTLKVEDCQGF